MPGGQHNNSRHGRGHGFLVLSIVAIGSLLAENLWDFPGSVPRMRRLAAGLPLLDMRLSLVLYWRRTFGIFQAACQGCDDWPPAFPCWTCAFHWFFTGGEPLGFSRQRAKDATTGRRPSLAGHAPFIGSLLAENLWDFPGSVPRMRRLAAGLPLLDMRLSLVLYWRRTFGIFQAACQGCDDWPPAFPCWTCAFHWFFTGGEPLGFS